MTARLIVLLVLSLGLAATPPACASWPRVDRAKAAAIAYWHATPAQCPVVWTLKAAALPSYYSAPGPRWAMATDAPWCRIYVRRDWYRRVGRRGWGWTFFCRAFVHEYGHLLGYGHSDDPANVMHSPAGHVPACEAA